MGFLFSIRVLEHYETRAAFNNSMDIFSYTSPQYYIFFFYFLLNVFLAFFIPGNLVLRNYKLSLLQTISLSISLGIVLWGFFGLLFGYTHLRWLSYAYIIVSFVVWVMLVGKNKPKFSWSKSHFIDNKILYGILIISILFQFSSIWLMGVGNNNEVVFCCRSVPDNLYHFALTSSLIQSFPPYEPGMSGIIVHNYHYLSNLVIADFVRVFDLPLLITQGQFFPLLLTSILGLTIMSFGQLLKWDKTYIAWFLFLTCFHGDIVYLLAFITTGKLDFSISLFDDATKLSTAPPFYFGVAIFFASLQILILWLRSKANGLAIILSLMIASLVGFKIYIAIFSFIGLLSLMLYSLIKTKEIKKIFPFAIAFILSALIYFPVNSTAGGLIWTGFWRVRDFIVQPVLHLSSLELQREIYVAHGNIKGALFDIWFLFLYLLSFFGILLIGFFLSRKNLRLLPFEMNLFLLPSIFCSVMIGIFMFQTVGGANTIQFIIFTTYVLGIYAAIRVTTFLRQVPIRFAIILGIFIVALTVPRGVYDSLMNYSLQMSGNVYRLSSADLDTFKAVKRIVPSSSLIGSDTSELETTAYILPLFTQRQFFLVGERILTDHGVMTQTRKRMILEISTALNTTMTYNDLKRDNIDYLLLSSNEKRDNIVYLKKLYGNSDITLYKVM